MVTLRLVVVATIAVVLGGVASVVPAIGDAVADMPNLSSLSAAAASLSAGIVGLWLLRREGA